MAVDASGQVVIRRQLKRRYLLTFFQKLPSRLVGIDLRLWSPSGTMCYRLLDARGYDAIQDRVSPHKRQELLLHFFYSRFLRALFQFGKSAACEAAKLGSSGVELLGVVGAGSLECGEPAAEAAELIRRQLGNRFGDFFDFHAAQYSTVTRKPV